MCGHAPIGGVLYCGAMEWSDHGLVLSVRPHGETSAIASLLTRTQGRHAGLVRGGAGRQLRPVLQPGNLLAVTWRARLADQLGNFTCEPDRLFGSAVIDDPVRLLALSSAVALADLALPEREAHPAVFDGLKIVLECLDGEHWPSVLVKWEVGVLGDLGFGLDLERCAATGRNDDLAYVSPRTGRAVGLAAGEAYRDRLLRLPRFLIEPGTSGDAGEVYDGLVLTGYFLERHVLAPLHKGLPPARQRLLGWLREQGA